MIHMRATELRSDSVPATGLRRFRGTAPPRSMPIRHSAALTPISCSGSATLDIGGARKRATSESS